MKKTVKTIIFALIACAAMAQTTGVKIGYLNAQAILADMSDVKAANSEIEAFVKQLQAKDSVMVVAFQGKYQQVVKAQEEGTLSPVQLEQKKKELTDEQAKIQKFEAEMEEAVAKKREEKLKPILEKVNNAIQTVAKENGYLYVIDATAGTLLYADEANDLQNLVRTKLGLPAVNPPAKGK